MKPGEETLGEASQMLRDILKNSGKECADQQVRDNNNTLKTLDTVSNPPPLNGFCAASHSENHDAMNAVLLGKSSSSGAVPVEDNNIQLESFHSLSGDETDVDISFGQTDDKDDAQKENDREQDEAVCSVNSMSPADSKEAKRARVENILTSIRQCPQTGYDSLAQASYNDMKRQKRKQPQPQQHEVKTSLASRAKYRKLECLVLHKHILHLQKQLHAVKKSFSQISRCSSDDEDRDGNTSYEDFENEDSVPAVVSQVSNKDVVTPTARGVSPRNHHQELMEHLSSPAFCLNGKLTGEGSENNKYFLKDGDNHGLQNGHLTVPTFQPSLSSQHVSLSLKSEIIQAVKKAVDSAVITVLEKHAGCVNSQQQVNHQENDSQVQQQQQHFLSKSPKREDDLQQPLTIPRPRQEREALKETVSNSQTVRPAELIIPFPEHLRFLERLGSQRQPPEKQAGAFGPILPRSEPSSLIKPHPSPALPFPPHFPYSGYMPSALLPPLFPLPEPEQTEALPLVVCSVTKKKRTKVTDTRLTPRGKSTPLPDSDHTSAMAGEAEDEGLTPLSSPFPRPYLPPVLPTSVAITNPSLHHSELFGGFRLHESAFDTPRPSSPACERDPTKSPQQGVGSLQSEVLDTSAPASPADGQTASKTATLTPMHLRKAKLMFFFSRYPNSGVLKSYFPDVSFNKNNTAQLVKWFSNFREFYYIQMEKSARQAFSEGRSQTEELTVPRDGELFRQLSLHYNRNNQIEVPESFRIVAETSLREFFQAIHSKKDLDSSWKKAIYKVIARLDEPVPEFLKSPNWMQYLGEA